MSVFRPLPADATTNSPICFLESLPNDVLAAILSECISFEDLHAFIRASPIVFRCFQATKRGVFVSILSRFLGPGIRDAVAVALTPQLDSNQEGYANRLSEAIDRYLSLPAGLASTRGLELYNVTYLVNFNRTVQFWVNEYFDIRANVIAERCKGTVKPLSRAERHRLAQAVVRYQLFMRLKPGALIGRPENLPPLRKLMAQYETWEILQVDAVIQLVREIVRLSNSLPTENRPVMRTREGYEMGWLRRWRRERQRMRVDYLRDIAMLRHHEMDHQETVIRKGELGWADWRRSEREMSWDGCGGSPYFDKRYIYINYIEGSRPEMCWGYMTSGFAAHSDPPPGWVDALDEFDGHICWGKLGRHDDAEKNGLLPGNPGSSVIPSLQWQLLGFMFWDKDRVLQIKEAVMRRYQNEGH